MNEENEENKEGQIENRDIVEEMSESYLTYSMSVSYTHLRAHET